jgi:hypothetical protein
MRSVVRLLSASFAPATTRSSVLRGVLMEAQCARRAAGQKSADRLRARSRTGIRAGTAPPCHRRQDAAAAAGMAAAHGTIGRAPPAAPAVSSLRGGDR